MSNLQSLARPMPLTVQGYSARHRSACRVRLADVTAALLGHVLQHEPLRHEQAAREQVTFRIDTAVVLTVALERPEHLQVASPQNVHSGAGVDSVPVEIVLLWIAREGDRVHRPWRRRLFDVCPILTVDVDDAV